MPRDRDEIEADFTPCYQCSQDRHERCVCGEPGHGGSGICDCADYGHNLMTARVRYVEARMKGKK